MAHVSGYDAFAPIYDTFAAAMTEDVPFYVELAAEAQRAGRRARGRHGRVAVPIAERIGRRVIGIDVSAGMLEVARDRAAAAGIELELRQGDMRELSLDEPTDLVICPFRSLLHLPGPTPASPSRRVAAALVPGGRFAWNAFVFDPAIATRSTASGATRTASGTARLRPRRTASTSSSRAARGVALVGRPRRVGGVIAEAGLEIEALYGWFDRRPFDDSSREFVYVARRPG